MGGTRHQGYFDLASTTGAGKECLLTSPSLPSIACTLAAALAAKPMTRAITVGVEVRGRMMSGRCGRDGSVRGDELE